MPLYTIAANYECRRPWLARLSVCLSVWATVTFKTKPLTGLQHLVFLSLFDSNHENPQNIRPTIQELQKNTTTTQKITCTSNYIKYNKNVKHVYLLILAYMFGTRAWSMEEVAVITKRRSVVMVVMWNCVTTVE